MVMEVFRILKEKFNYKLDLRIFGCDPKTQIIDAEFFNNLNYNFDFTNYGIIDSEYVSSLLQETDIFFRFINISSYGASSYGSYGKWLCNNMSR